jgi:hypothetical protein
MMFIAARSTPIPTVNGKNMLNRLSSSLNPGYAKNTQFI